MCFLISPRQNDEAVSRGAYKFSQGRSLQLMKLFINLSLVVWWLYFISKALFLIKKEQVVMLQMFLNI